MEMTDTLELSEPHPACRIAMDYIQGRVGKYSEAIYSTALSGNRMAEIAAGTLRRLENKEPVSDRYLMGLACFIYGLENAE